MARLIDADVLIKHLEDWRKNWEKQEESYEKAWTLTAIDYFTSLVNKKIAYDVEKVVEELHEFSLNTIPYCNEMLREDLCDDSNDCDYCKLQHAIEIVRKGGVNDD